MGEYPPMDNPGLNGSSQNGGGISRSISKSDHSLSDRTRACRARRSSAGMVMRGTNEGGRLGVVSTSESMNWSSDADNTLPIDSLSKIVDMRRECFRVGRLSKSSLAPSCSGFCFFGREGRRTDGCESGEDGGGGKENEGESGGDEEGGGWGEFSG